MLPSPCPPPPLTPATASAPACGAAQVLCASADLAERGLAHCFDVLHHDQPTPAFALRFEGQVVAYLNRCAHVPVEMDWQRGQFLDHEQRWIICSIHGAAYEPANGRCIGGPCRGARLHALSVGEADGQVLWWPDAHTQPLPPGCDIR